MGLNWMDFNFRQYDPQIARFLSVDPLAASTDMMSPYTAMNNQPASMTDPHGLKAQIYLSPSPNIIRSNNNPLLAMMPSVGEYMERNFGYGRIVGMMLADMDYKQRLADERRWQEATGEGSTYSPIIGIPSFVCNYAGAGSGGGGETPTDTDPQNGGNNPDAKGRLDRYKNEAISIYDWYDTYKGKTWEQIAAERGYQYGKGPIKALPLGPKYRYVLDPLNSEAVIDMRHFTIMGSLGRSIGDAVEWGQNYTDKNSSNDPQDYYSNELGYKFYDLMNNHPERFAPYYQDIRGANPYTLDYGRLIGIFLMTPELRK